MFEDTDFVAACAGVKIAWHLEARPPIVLPATLCGLIVHFDHFSLADAAAGCAFWVIATVRCVVNKHFEASADRVCFGPELCAIPLVKCFAIDECGGIVKEKARSLAVDKIAAAALVKHAACGVSLSS